MEDDFGQITNLGEKDPIPVGYIVHLDATAKDNTGTPTDSNGDVRFTFSDPSLISVAENQPFQRKLKVLNPGTEACQAALDNAKSNVVTLKLRQR